MVDGSSDWVSGEIANGPLTGRTLHWLVGEFGKSLTGDVPLAGQGQFPILIKFLDAKEDLSVQVHPPKEYADANPGAHLKSEAWYVIDAAPGASIFKGLRQGVTADQFAADQAATWTSGLAPGGSRGSGTWTGRPRARSPA